MRGTMENRLENLIHELKELKKDLILQKAGNLKVVHGKAGKWQALADRVSAQWDGVSAVEEVSQQREKNR